MKFDALTYLMVTSIWAVISGTLGYFLSKGIAENPKSIGVLNFFLGLIIPPISWISLVLLSLKIKKVKSSN
ncbi:hypothetical protein GCM10023150_06570 [Kangiella taiwanensis]|uniref:Uncharacterized protein n=1 Tax=Kangiella taiwanensis TaxID=1079179 RepID=A0ABP8HW19_9GAMM